MLQSVQKLKYELSVSIFSKRIGVDEQVILSLLVFDCQILAQQ